MANSKAQGVAYSDQAIVSGSVDDSPVGATTPSTGAFTTLSSSGDSDIGNAAADLIGFHGVTGVAQANTIASISTSQPVATTTPTTVYGFAASAQFNSLIAAMNSVLTVLQNKGFIA